MTEQDEEARKALEAQGIQFHYSRSERLEKVPEHKKLYNGEMRLQRGLFRALFNAPGGKYMVYSLVILFALVFALRILDRRNEDVINGVQISLSAFSFEDTVYVTLKMDKKDITDPFVVTADFGAFDAEKTMIEKKTITAEYKGEELSLRTTFMDFDITKIIVNVKSGDIEKTVSAGIGK